MPASGSSGPGAPTPTLAGWLDVPLADILERRLGLP
ncbi:ROK family protein, partial [Mesorhizobium sp. M7A.F.Ca.ET.027.03.2.1]